LGVPGRDSDILIKISQLKNYQKIYFYVMYLNLDSKRIGGSGKKKKPTDAG
jgi:hypothetical protein